MMHSPQIAILNGENEKAVDLEGICPFNCFQSNTFMILRMMFLRFSIERLRFPSQPCFVNIINVSRFQVPYCCHLLYIISHVMVSIIRYGHWFTHFCIAKRRLAEVKHNHIRTTYIQNQELFFKITASLSQQTKYLDLFGLIRPTQELQFYDVLCIICSLIYW